jgi:archaellum biogenesis ATPase FlaH
LENCLDFSIKNLFGKDLPKEQNFLIIEDINAKGEFFLLKLVEEFRKIGYHTVLVLLDSLPSTILEELVVKESDDLSIVNTYSTVYSRYYTSIKLHELSLTLKSIRRELQNERKLAIFVWSLNPLFINYSSNDVINFYLENVKHGIENKTIEFYLVEKGLIEDIAMRRLIALAHCVIELERNDSCESCWNIRYLKTIGLNLKHSEIIYKYKVGSSIWDSQITFIDHL